MHFVIVLGNSREDVRRLRVNVAVNYYHSISQPCMLVFSGKGGTLPSESELMYDYAVNELMVDPNDCIIENESMSTIENFEYTRSILKLYATFEDTFVICTSTFHLPRAYTIASFILGNMGKITTIHTNEPVTIQDQTREGKAIFNFLSTMLK